MPRTFEQFVDRQRWIPYLSGTEVAGYYTKFAAFERNSDTYIRRELAEEIFEAGRQSGLDEGLLSQGVPL